MKFHLGLLFVIIILCSCNNPSAENQQAGTFDNSDMPELEAEVEEIIYSLYLPTDIAQLFEETGTNFNPDLTIPLDIISHYEQPEQMALIIGALGIDLSYCKIFEQPKIAGSYYEAIEELSRELELPDSLFESTSRDIEKYFDRPDTLTVIIDNLYKEVNRHFEANDQSALASISLFGGWIEAMFIGADIYESKNHLEMGDRILQQKFTLNNIISLLSNYQESLTIRGYILMLNRLKTQFDLVEIMYAKEGFEIDTTMKRLQTSRAEIKYEKETLDEISLLIRQIRQELLK